VFNAVGVVFKGSGFYRNDSRNGSGPDEKPAAAEDGGTKGTDEKGGPAKVDAAKTGTAKTTSDKGDRGGSSPKEGAAPKPASTGGTSKDSPNAA
jgi:hypothetical protein